MDKHLSQDDIGRYGKRALGPQEILSADRHLEACAQCRATLNNLTPAAYSIASIQKNLRRAAGDQAAHLSYDRLEAYAEGRADSAERQLVEAHCKSCQMCSKEAGELQRFASAMASDAAPKPETEAQPFGKRLLSLFGLASGWSFSTAAVSAVALLLMLGATVFYVYYRSSRTGAPQVAQSLPPDNPSQTGQKSENSNQSVPPAPTNSVPPGQAEQKAAPVIAFFVLKPTGTREGGAENTLTVPREAQLVRILVGVEGEDYPSYRTEVRTLEGKRIWVRTLMPRKTKQGKALILQVPANLLRQDAYSVKLRGKPAAGGSEELDEYFFTVKR